MKSHLLLKWQSMSGECKSRKLYRHSSQLLILVRQLTLLELLVLLGLLMLLGLQMLQ